MPKPDPDTALDLLLQVLAERLAECVGEHLTERIAALVEARLAGPSTRAAVDTIPGGDYVDYTEPGPQSPRQYFDAKELARRWNWGVTKVYEIPERELPYWKRGQLKRYFWAHVWAYEGRLSSDEAERIHAFQTQEIAVLSDSPTEPARLRPLRSHLDARHQ